MSPLLIAAVAVAWLLGVLCVYALCRASALADRDTARLDVEARAADRIVRYNPVTGKYEDVTDEYEPRS